MKIMLIDPPSPRKQIHEPIGLLSIAAYSKKLAPDVSFTCISCDLDEINIDSMPWNKYDIFGISSKLNSLKFIMDMYDAYELSESEATFVVGGVIATYAYAELAKRLPKALFVIGDGEVTFFDIIKTIREGGGFLCALQKLNNHPSIYSSISTDKKNIFPSITPIKDLVPPCRRDLHRYVQAGAQIQLEGSRGCSWNRCSFCSIPTFNVSGWRPVPPNFLFEQFATLSQHGALFPHFTDSDFFGRDLDRAISMAQGVIDMKRTGELNQEMTFYVNLLVSGIIGGLGNASDKCEEALRLWGKAGLREVFIGIESGVDEQIRRYKKPSNRYKNMLALKKLADLKIDSDIGFIMFDPLSTLDELYDNVRYIMKPELRYHPSRLTHRLRLQAGADLTSKMINCCHDGLINIDSLSYNYSFINKDIEDIYEEFLSWEDGGADLYYIIQSIIRSSNVSDMERQRLKSYLGNMRYIDKLVLKSIIEKKRMTISQHKYKKTLEKMKQKREAMFLACPESVMHYDQNYMKSHSSVTSSVD